MQIITSQILFYFNVTLNYVCVCPPYFFILLFRLFMHIYLQYKLKKKTRYNRIAKRKNK